jgi:hypothetical protein
VSVITLKMQKKNRRDGAELPVLEPKLKTRRAQRPVRPQLLTKALLRRAELGSRSATAKAAAEMMASIQSDMGGAAEMSAVATAIAEGFVGCYLMVSHFNAKLILLKENEALDIGGYTALLRALAALGAQLGLARKQREVGPSLGALLREGQKDG